MNKEQYLNMRKSWKNFIANKKHRKYKSEFEIYPFNPETGNYEKDIGFEWKSDLTVYHHIVYNLLVHGTTEKSYKGKIPYHIWSNLYWIGRHEKMHKKFLEPFGEDMTIDILREELSKYKVKF